MIAMSAAKMSIGVTVPGLTITAQHVRFTTRLRCERQYVVEWVNLGVLPQIIEKYSRHGSPFTLLQPYLRLPKLLMKFSG